MGIANEVILAETSTVTTPAVAELAAGQGTGLMEQMQRDAVIFLLERIARKELITEDEFRKKAGVSRKWIAEAVKADRLFFMRSPSGENFYPSFYGDPAYERQSLELICEKLGRRPGSSKFHFFTRKSICLDVQTPLEALKDGMLTKILVLAERLPSAWQPVGSGAETRQALP